MFNRRVRRLGWLPVILICGPWAGAEEPLTFNAHIRPILSENCYTCHGPDANAREARLRLDTFEGAVERGAIVPGAPDESEILARILHDNPYDRMPPPETNLRITDEEVAYLRRWIAEGAAYEPHWAFKPVAAPEPPAAPHPIDGFLDARLAAEGLAPSGEAARETLIRRVTLDLTGLPPTLGEIDAFLNDTEPGAYGRLVDRLLESPAYGERMANDWLDVARYADTYGYQADRPNHMWPWRDWVIRALNDNLSYDQFVKWQIAGDLLPDPTQDQVLATAFNRLHRQTNEGGSILEEFHTEYVADRVHTFGTAFLAMTMECARCHDHKYDPISQREYFELFSFFNNIDESGMYSHFTDAIPTPTAFLYKEGERAQHAALQEALALAEARLLVHNSLAETTAYPAWRDGSAEELTAPKPLAALPLDHIEDGTTPVLGGTFDVSFEGQPVLVPGRSGKAMAFNGDDGLVVAGLGDFERTDPFSVSLWIHSPATAAHEVVLHHSQAREDAGSRGWYLLLQDGKPTFGLAHFWPGNAVKVQATEAIPGETWTHLAVTYDGSSRADGIRIYLDGRPAPASAIRDNLYKSIRYEGGGPKGLTLAHRFRDTGLRDGSLSEVRLFDRALTGLEVRWVAEGDDATPPARAPETEALYAEHFREQADDEAAALRRALQEAREAENRFVQGLREISVMAEMDTPRQAYILETGAYDSIGDPVEPNTPEAIFPFPEDYPRDRLGLAQWLVHEDNPLTARVAVNRAWQLFFGRGLVDTQEDFGGQGSLPSHPELLDWLASAFVASGWDMKALHRLIVTSAAYRRDSTPRPDLADDDPENILLAVGPRKRLDAEHIRDQALAASGLLVPEIGGPSVKPYHPPGLWEDASSTPYVQDEGDALYRRSMYTFWKRTVPPPNMTTFDAVDREVCSARRETTATPLQALVLLNDPIFVESSRVLAERMTAAHARPADQVETAFRMLTGRQPDEREREVLREAYEEQRRHFRRHPEDAAAYTAVGEWPDAEDLDRARLAALTAVIQAIMNFYEFQVKT